MRLSPALRSRGTFLVVLGLVLGTGGGATIAAFTATSSNSGNSVQAASSFAALRFASGTYIGDAGDDRAITGLGFQPDAVIIKGNTNQTAVARTSTMSGDLSKPMVGGAALTSDHIQSLDADGFTIGHNNRVNASGIAFYWMAFKTRAGAFKVGSYNGNGTSQAISGVGFSPEYVVTMSAAGDRAVQRVAGMTTSFQFDADTGNATRITSLDSDGFSVGSSNEVNKSGTTIHYLAWNDLANSIKTGSYSGDGLDNKSVSGVGFRPDYVIVKANDTSAGKQGSHLPAALTDSSLLFGATANITDGIKSLQSDGFQLGTNAAVNTSGTTYHYVAFKNSGGGCSMPGSQTIIASSDSWLDQANPTTNKGGDSTIRARSKSGSQNKRALVQFPLPALPSDCSFTSALLRLRNKAPDAGRTIEVLRNAASWTEAGVTWNNQPATTGSVASATSPAAAGWMEWTVTSQIQDIWAGANYGFHVRDSAEDNATGFEQQFDSRDAGATWPELVLTFG